ncbi:TspO/MBR family protein [Nocardioides ferulae]|uniref:TspO/MBR family protein n=1 Tax=Nocardioides ferulae TaxID=2340821 RepID=UPI000EAEB3AD|nr:TspO/MBR family protein [Nocardioides ferulae]
MRLRTLLSTSTATGATAAIGSLASQNTRSRWYRKLDKPDFQPPAEVFSVVWTALYADIAVASASAIDRLEQESPEAARAYRRALAVNLALNASWTWVFFSARRLPAATAVAGALAVSSADLARRSGQADPKLGLALAPYALWCGFATVLSEAIRRRNG